MSWRKWTVLTTAVLAAAAVLLFMGCGALGPVKHKAPTWRPASLAVLPFSEVLPTSGNAAMARSPLTFAVYTSGNISPSAVAVLNDALMVRLPMITKINLVTGPKVGTMSMRVMRRGLYPNLRQSLAALGRQLKVDGVMVGYVYRFQDREGGQYAVSRAASVAFDLAVVRSSDGVVVWKNSFDQTQQPLSDNLMRLGEYARHGIRWLSADEFGRFGMDQLLLDFPWRKKAGK